MTGERNISDFDVQDFHGGILEGRGLQQTWRRDIYHRIDDGWSNHSFAARDFHGQTANGRSKQKIKIASYAIRLFVRKNTFCFLHMILIG